MTHFVGFSISLSNRLFYLLDLNQRVTRRPATAVEGNRVGYFTAMMNKSSPTTSLHDAFVTSTRQDSDSASISGGAIVYPGGFIENNPQRWNTFLL